jgi:hypothetical protein
VSPPARQVRRGAILAAVTPVELRHAVVGYPVATICAAVAAGLPECALPDVPADPQFADLVVFWLTDPAGREWLTPRLPENTIAAIHRHLVASAD